MAAKPVPRAQSEMRGLSNAVRIGFSSPIYVSPDRVAPEKSHSQSAANASYRSLSFIVSFGIGHTAILCACELHLSAGSRLRPYAVPIAGVYPAGTGLCWAAGRIRERVLYVYGEAAAARWRETAAGRRWRATLPPGPGRRQK